MRKIGIVAIMSAAVLLAGCASNRDTGAVVGGVAGGILGSTIGGGAGRVVATGIGATVGAVVGGAVGGNMDHPRHYSYTPVYHTSYPTFEQCLPFMPGPERFACERGARQRLMQEQRRRENAAFRQGFYGH